ncbi:MAG: hypothetical protein KW793_02675 [Candidatus Doudnabacteria bacterium]|nr:hypothetical protein [Candidatus Doudnabacteria bacterium]
MKSKTQPRRKKTEVHHHREVMHHKENEAKHLLMGYLFLAIVFMGAISSVYYWENKTKYASATPSADRYVESGEQIPTTACDLKTVKARQKATGEIREFASPCHVTQNWEIVK